MNVLIAFYYKCIKHTNNYLFKLSKLTSSLFRIEQPTRRSRRKNKHELKFEREQRKKEELHKMREEWFNNKVQSPLLMKIIHPGLTQIYEDKVCLLVGM